jgi:pyridoxine 4-dehydrogenase
LEGRRQNGSAVATPRTATLGDYEINRIGLGTNRLTHTPENRALLEAAVEGGIGLIDTAHVYAGGDSERTIGAALAPFPDEVVVATKGGYERGSSRPDRLRAQLEESFERLQAETISLYYLHRVDPEVPLEESLGLLREYRDAGRIRNVGVSAVTVDQIRRARAVVPIAAVQNHYSLSERKYDDVVEFCESEDITFVPYFPLREVTTGAPLDEIANRHDATREQIMLAWLLKRSPVTVPIPGTLSPEHLRENLAALDLELSDEDHAALSSG